MKPISFLYLLPVLWVLAFACNKPANPSTPQTESMIQLKNPGCRGYCPAFELTLKNDGSATYWGRRNVEPIGTFKGNLGAKTTADLFTQFDEAGFAEMSDEYLGGMSDIPRIKLTHDQKTITFHEREAPEKLVGLMQAMEAQVKVIEWEQVAEE